MLQIIQTIENDKERSFIETLYMENEKRLYRISFDILHNHHDAEDCVNETIVNVIKYLPKFMQAEEIYLKNLLLITCKNIAINMYNKNQNQKYVSLYSENEDGETEEFEISDTDEEISKLVIDEEKSNTVRQIVSVLDDKYRDIIMLKYFHNFKANEIAKLLSIKEETVFMRLSRARKMILKKGGDTLYELYKE